MGVERDGHLDRFLTFVDAIVAIAITLLVLPLVELTARVDEYDSVAALVRENQAEIWAFLLSFYVISRFWLVQHHTMRHVVQYDGRIAGLVMGWALTIVFLPFPTALVAEAASSTLTKVLYIGTMIVSMVLMAVVEGYLVRHPELTDGEDDADPVSGAANAFVLVVALALSVAFDALSYFPLLLLFVAGPVANLWRRVREGGSRGAPVGE